MPPGCIVCSRPGRWGNPHRVAPAVECDECRLPEITPAIAVQLHRAEWQRRLANWPDATRHSLDALRRHDLACWCRLCPAHVEGKPLGVTCDDCAPCHVDTLLELANA